MFRNALKPDRVVIGTESEKAKNIIKEVYDVLSIIKHQLFYKLETAEMNKVCINAFFICKDLYINELALLSEKVGANSGKLQE